MIKYVFFDFDGTIADTFGFIKEIGKDLLDSVNLSHVNLDWENLEAYRGMNIWEFSKEIGIPIIKLPGLILKFRKEATKKIHLLKPINGIKEVLDELTKDYALGILTTNSKENVEIFLQNNGFENFFCCIISELQLLGKHISLRKIMRRQRINKHELIYIGDELRDILAANKLGLKSIAVLWGLNTKEVLQEASPTFFAQQPRDIITFIKEMQ